MKKMVCEVCGSTRIQKNNNIFECQECGIQYSLEEIRKLLVDVENINDVTNNETMGLKNFNIEKNLLLKQLLIWAELIEIFENLNNNGINIKNPWTDDFYIETIYSSTKEDFIKNINLYKKSEYEFFKAQLTNMEHTYLKESYDKLIRFYNEIKKYEIRDGFGIGGIIVVRGTKHERFFGDFNEVIPNRYGTPISFDQWVDRLRRKKTILVKRDVSGIFISKDLKFDICDFDKCILEIDKICESVANKYINEFYNEVVEKLIEERINLYKELVLYTKDCEEKFYLPIQYRNIKSIVGIIKIIYDGKADSWKEAVTLFDTEVFRKNLLNGIGNVYYLLSDLKKSIEIGLDKISTDLKQIDNKLLNIDRSLSSLNIKMNKANDMLRKIKNYSFLTGVNSLL